ncbi:MAG: DUF2127 domain-containing protein [Janthinobacterium lividum]
MTTRQASAEPGKHPDARRRTLRLIAAFEAFKGLAVFAASIGLLGLLHHDGRRLARELIAHLGMEPTAHYPAILLHFADLIENANLRNLVVLACGYVVVRLVEAVGLWRNAAWAEWLGALSGALYIPFEIRHLLHKPSLAAAAVFVSNIVVIAFLGYQLWRRRSHDETRLLVERTASTP